MIFLLLYLGLVSLPDNERREFAAQVALAFMEFLDTSEEGEERTTNENETDS